MKRLVDVFVSISGLILLSPVFLILAILIGIESKGGIFYRQNRVGKNNKEFKLYKFRSMYFDSEKKGLLTIGGKDARITKTGFFIRKYKLDELAQLINVLIGNMSLVGPRPEVQKYVALYNNEQMQVLTVKPGITDYASIEYSHENDILAKSDNPEYTYINDIMPHKLELNLKYIKEQSLWVDFMIVIKTLIKIVSK